MTLPTNRAGFRMIYFQYDEEALAKFGLRLYNREQDRLLNIPCSKARRSTLKAALGSVQNSPRFNPFFINRLGNGENDFVSIEIVENVTV